MEDIDHTDSVVNIVCDWFDGRQARANRQHSKEPPLPPPSLGPPSKPSMQTLPHALQTGRYSQDHL